jgi:hypothetical protein
MKFNPYSFSKMNSFELCPKKFELSYIKKIKTFTPNLATERGSYIHLLLEHHEDEKEVNFKFNIMQEEDIQKAHEVYEKFVESDLGKYYFSFLSESEIAFGVKRGDEGFEPCGYGNKEALFRGKIDYFAMTNDTVIVADWKTGKVTDYPAPLQLVMYAAWVFLKYPEIEKVISSFVYVEHLEEKQYIFKRSHLTAILKKIVEKIVKIEKATDFEKSESPLCEYCSYRAEGYCDETTQEEFQQNVSKFSTGRYGKEKELFYFIHPESGCAWIQDYKDPGDLDGLAEEIEAGMFYNLEDFGYDPADIDKTIHTKDEK